MQVNVISYSGCGGRRGAGGAWGFDFACGGGAGDVEAAVEYWACAKRRAGSCCTGSGLLVDRGVNLEADLEKRESVRTAEMVVGMSGIMSCLVHVQSEREQILCLDKETEKLKKLPSFFYEAAKPQGLI